MLTPTQSLLRGLPQASFLDAFHEMAKRAKGYRHDRAFEDVVRGDLTTSSRSSTVGVALALQCLASPRRGAASPGSLPSPEGDESHFLGIYNIAAPALAFVFFPQMGLRMAHRRSKAVADGPTAPWVGCRAAKPYLLAWWSGPSVRRWDPLVQNADTYSVK
jgi:hypothetical protein